MFWMRKIFTQFTSKMYEHVFITLNARSDSVSCGAYREYYSPHQLYSDSHEQNENDVLYEQMLICIGLCFVRPLNEINWRCIKVYTLNLFIMVTTFGRQHKIHSSVSPVLWNREKSTAQILVVCVESCPLK